MRYWLGVCLVGVPCLGVSCRPIGGPTLTHPVAGSGEPKASTGAGLPEATEVGTPGEPAVVPEPAAAAEPAKRAHPFNDADIAWAANPVMRRLGRIAETMNHSEYSYGFRVDESRGTYEFDCSGMAYWVLRQATPRAAAALAYKLEKRPLARDIQRRIASIPRGRPRYGWQRVARVDALEPGDVVAWIKPKVIQSPNTGHVAFVVLPPQRAVEYQNAYLLRIADSTRLLHDADTRVGRNGFGFGTILLVADPASGAPIAYGWAGLKWRTFETQIALGRPLE